MDERLIVIVGYDTAELLDIACVTTSLAMANGIGNPALPYRVSVASPGGHPITCGSGLTLQSQQPLERLTGPLDTLIVSGGLGHERAAADPRLVGHVRRLAKESRRVASVCTGAGILAATGLLDGRRATTHWRHASQLAAQHPEAMGDGVHCYDPDGTLIGRLDVPEAVANISWGGAKRNRLFIAAETSLYSVVMGVTGTHPTGPGRRPWL